MFRREKSCPRGIDSVCIGVWTFVARRLRERRRESPYRLKSPIQLSGAIAVTGFMSAAFRSGPGGRATGQW